MLAPGHLHTVPHLIPSKQVAGCIAEARGSVHVDRVQGLLGDDVVAQQGVRAPALGLACPAGLQPSAHGMWHGQQRGLEAKAGDGDATEGVTTGALEALHCQPGLASCVRACCITL